ncbi:hypothetical protein QMA10_09350 [Arthrobacter sp. APC 3897]|uniref:hypothetical protein n=1 Tax=Arthrobacter sp. APC 3897 TaxID=3035204 RepID=UPI0025B4112A|nr:hypothetical protein [Arthrobacter sp. APC 3897]MDN3482122.1 hypothetical protein [Arthrobacter sp. APC 3897]
MSADEVDLLKWPASLPACWSADPVLPAAGFAEAFAVTEAGEPRGVVQVGFVVRGELDAAYPASVRDRVLQPSADAAAEALQLVSEKVMAADRQCRRLVIATAEGDVAEIARAERAGYRYVVDVDLPDRSVSLMAAEPAWVLEESRRIDDVPTR